MFPQQANAVFLEMPPRMIDGLRERGWRFYTFIGTGGARFMCSWETTEEDVAALVADMISLAGQD
jgi:threonine aldolase